MVYLCIIPGTVSGGADLVRDVDTAFAGESLSVLRIEASEFSGYALQAVADGPAVGGGPCGGHHALDPVAARWCGTLTRLNVTTARRYAACDLTTCDGLSDRCAHHSHAHDHHKCNLKASHFFPQRVKENA